MTFCDHPPPGLFRHQIWFDCRSWSAGQDKECVARLNHRRAYCVWIYRIEDTKTRSPGGLSEHLAQDFRWRGSSLRLI